jgi:hypothetical protein
VLYSFSDSFILILCWIFKQRIRQVNSPNLTGILHLAFYLLLNSRLTCQLGRVKKQVIQFHVLLCSFLQFSKNTWYLNWYQAYI